MFGTLTHALDRRFRLRPDQAVYIGNDLRNDIWTARQAGPRIGLFAGDRRSLRWRKDDSRSLDLKPDALITVLDQIAELI